MPNGNWAHIILDPTIYTSHRTHRVARIGAGISTFTHAFSDPRLQGTFPRGGNYRPTRTEIGAVPEEQRPPYQYKASGNAEWGDLRLLSPQETDSNARTFRFGFWSFITETNEGPRGEFHNTSIPDGAGVSSAKAFFFWDLGAGPGEHAVYLDAFDRTAGEFIPQDFVDVVTNSPESPRTAEANDGQLFTAAIGPTKITAREVITDPFSGRNLYQFSHWEPIYLPNPSLAPGIVDAELSIDSDYLGTLIAVYDQFPGEPLNLPPQKDPRKFWQNILSGQAGGPVIVIGGNFPWGDMGPIGPEPGDTFLPRLEKISYQIEDLNARMNALEAIFKKT